MPAPQMASVSPAETALRAMIGQRPRRGDLVVTDTALMLRLRRGDHSTPLMSVPRGTYELGCVIEPLASDEAEVHEDVWWLFTAGPEAVALQFTTSAVVAWFWEPERQCAVRATVVDAAAFGETPPPQYYAGDDAQVAYRQNTRGSTTGDRDVDFLPTISGAETLIVEPGFIAIHTAAGRTLLQHDLEIDPDWQCYHAEINVFRTSSKSLYAAVSFEAFGSASDCDTGTRDLRLATAIFDWDAAREVFVARVTREEQQRGLTPVGLGTRVELTRDLDVEGGRLRLHHHTQSTHSEGIAAGCDAQDRAAGTCTTAEPCWTWASSSERHTSFRLLGHDGTDVALGSATLRTRDGGESCAPDNP